MTLSRRDIHFIRPLYKLAHFLAITPSYNFEKDSARNSLKFQAAVFALVILVWGAYCVLQRLQEVTLNASHGTVITQFLKSLDQTFVTCTAVVGCCSPRQTRNWESLLGSLQSVDRKLGNLQRKEKHWWSSSIFQQLLHLSACASLLLYQSNFDMNFGGWSRVQKYFIYYVCTFYETVVLALIYNFLVAFKLRYRDLNRLFSYNVKRFAAKPNTNSIAFLRDIGRLSVTMYEAVAAFNKIFGWFFFFVMGRGVVQILIAFNHSIVAKMEVALPSAVQRDVTILTMGSASFLMVLIAALTICSGRIVDQSRSLFILCCKLQQRFPSESRERKELLALSWQLEVCVVRIAAAGFFEVERKTIVGILATSTTYVIVILQFGGVL